MLFFVLTEKIEADTWDTSVKIHGIVYLRFVHLTPCNTENNEKSSHTHNPNQNFWGRSTDFEFLTCFPSDSDEGEPLRTLCKLLAHTRENRSSTDEEHTQMRLPSFYLKLNTLKKW